MKLAEMVDCEKETKEDSHDPEEVEDVMSVGALDHGARWACVDFIRVCCQTPTEECWAEVDSNRGEPDHEQGEQAALTGVGE